jgi:group I intron endonuclease
MGYIYKITNKVNGKSYIGYTENPTKRWQAHQRRQGSEIVFQAIKKYGLKNLNFEVIAEDNVTGEDRYIQEHNTMYPTGYNLTPGGSLPPNHRGKTYEEIYKCTKRANEQKTKRLARQKLAGGYGPKKHTEETKQKISNSISGKNHPMYGKVHSSTTIKKMKETRKGQNAGSKNNTAKKWKLTSPEGNEHFAHGNLYEKCKELGLSFSTVHASHMYKRPMRSGWKVEELNGK